MTEWTAERLDALPDGLGIRSSGRLLVKEGYWWRGLDGSYRNSVNIAPPRSNPNIEIVSVPIDALTSPDAVRSARDDLAGCGNWITKQDAATVIRAAISSATGGAR